MPSRGLAREKGKVTINDIARLANVSKKTVSRVINDSPLVREKTREKVKLVIAEHGFAPDPQARALAFRRSFLIAMIYDNPSPQYVVNMQRGILDTLEGTSFQLILRPCDRGDPQLPRELAVVRRTAEAVRRDLAAVGVRGPVARRHLGRSRLSRTCGSRPCCSTRRAA